jgi:antitoxin (DNA-binding transcriptional repressor) of toxin-antitoxin stability system
MQSVNIRQLRDTRRLKTWLRAGQTVELRERNQVIARIVPEQEEEKPGKWPDFEARAREILGDRVLPNVVLEDRGRY